MITHDQDPDIVRWGLQLFESDPYSNCGYCGTSTQDDADYYTVQYFKEDQYDLQSYNVESDELIAHALQAQLAISDLPESPHEGEEHSEASAFQQDWLEESIGNYSSGQEGQEEETDEMVLPSSCSSSQEMEYGGEEWSYPLELADEYAFDGEVEKWLNQMIPIPHVPRINGEIPSIDEATLDHQRLLDRLQVYDLVEHKVDGDGNCQFRALSDQFYRTAEHHEFVRQQVVNQPEIYEGYVPMAYGDYLEKMSKNGEWGDHVTLRAAADSYGVKIFVITSFKETAYIEILPNVHRSKRVILLSFGRRFITTRYIHKEICLHLEQKRRKNGRCFRTDTWSRQMSTDDFILVVMDSAVLRTSLLNTTKVVAGLQACSLLVALLRKIS